jgi:hypothetical protein
VTTTGNGNGRRTSRPVTVIDPAELAALDSPARLSRALAVTGLDVPAAARLLRQAGYPVSITNGKNDIPEDGDGLHAAHPVNVSDAGWSYSAQGSRGHEKCCKSRARGVYQGQRHAARIPYEHARIMTPEGRTLLASYLLSLTPDGRPVIITYDDIDRGRWPHRLGMTLSRDRRIRDAAATVLLDLVTDPDLPERPHALTPSTRDEHGRVPVPEWSTLPPGYGDTPAADAAARLAARQVQAGIAAQCPLIALAWGAAVAGPLAAAARVQSCGWELVGAPRTGKTSTMQLIAAAWGNPALPPDPGIMMSWDATSRGMGRLAGMLGTIPFIADETGTADFDPGEWARFQYGMAQGGARTLATMTGEGMKRTGGWAGFWFTSGNATVSANRAGRFAGIAARMLTLYGPFTRSADDARQLQSAVAGDYGFAGPAVLAAVDVAQFRAWHTAALDSIGRPDGGVLGTTAEQLAAAVAGAMGLDIVMGTGNRIAAAAARAARDYMGTASEPESDRARMLRTLAERLSSNRPAWPDRDAYEALGQAAEPIVPGGPRAAALARHGYESNLDGLRDETWLYVYPAAWERLADETGTDGPGVLRDLYASGDLHVSDSRRRKGEWTGPAPRWTGLRPSVYKLRLTALDVPDVDDGQDDGPGPGAAGPGPEPADADPWAATRADMAAVQQPELVPAAPALMPAPAAPAPVAAVTGRAAWLAATWDRPDNAKYFKAPGQRAALERITALLDAAADVDPADSKAVNDLADSLRLLAELEGHKRGETGGPFVPLLRSRKAWLSPWKHNPLPAVCEVAAITEGYHYDRADYHGPVTVIDKNGAWIGSIGSTPVAHGLLEQTGPWDGGGTPPPGYYKVTVYDWRETGMPSPLGNARPGTDIWVAAPVMGLLAELAAAGRWPDGTASDAWTGKPVRLDQWGRLIRETRRYGLQAHGPGSAAYQAAKDAVSKSISMMNGQRDPQSAAPRRIWPLCRTWRIDWRHHIITASAVANWRTLDRCRLLAAGDPALSPVGIRAKDEIMLPAAAVDLVTGTPWRPGGIPPVKLDPSGVALGTFKVKGTETRP